SADQNFVIRLPSVPLSNLSTKNRFQGKSVRKSARLEKCILFVPFLAQALLLFTSGFIPLCRVRVSGKYAETCVTMTPMAPSRFAVRGLVENNEFGLEKEASFARIAPMPLAGSALPWGRAHSGATAVPGDQWCPHRHDRSAPYPDDRSD